VTGDGPAWSHSSADLDVNLVRFDGGRGVTLHVNAEVDVLIVVLAGDGLITLDGRERSASAGTVCLIPKGTARALRSAGGPFAYVTCHRRRAGLMPG
jgi:mannose-6-phosphate isomerase-like protein (cupin superfamily)